MDVSIVIPTKNAGALFDKVLERVFQQETNYTYEVICVDSGSSDGTLDIIKNIHACYIRFRLVNLDMAKQEYMGRQKVLESILSSLLRMQCQRLRSGFKILLML